MQELLTYFEPNIVVRERNENFTHLFDFSKRYIYPMRVCRISDFQDRGFYLDGFDVKNRLCPDIT